MQLTDFLEAMERIAPRALALSFDNVGLLVGTERTEIGRVLVALDLTLAVADEAIRDGYDLVLTHHPKFFHPVQRILPDAPDTAAVYRLIRHGIALFSAHTNLDAAPGGVNDVLCGLLGVQNPVALPPEGIVRLGTLEQAETLSSFARRTERVLGGCTHAVGDPDAGVLRVAVVSGSGSDELQLARDAGADTLVTGEIRHSSAVDAEALGLNVLVSGHYETERVVLRPLIDRLQRETNDVLYKVALSDASPFRYREEG